MKTNNVIQWELNMILKLIKLFMSSLKIPMEKKKTAAIEIAATTEDTLKDETMKKVDEVKVSAAVKHLTSNTEHWLEIKKALEEEIRSNQELIILIDKKVRENELKAAKLN